MARNIFWYTPFSDLEGDVLFMADGGNQYQRENVGKLAANKVKVYINCNLRKPPLAGLTAGDRLYVVGHGDIADGIICADDKEVIPTGYTDRYGKPALTADQLIKKMEADGCDWKIDDIRICACKAARGGKSFVKEFADLVVAKNKDVVVYGYASMLDRSTPPGGHRKRAMFDTGGASVAASKYRVSYGRQKTPSIPIDNSGGAKVWVNPLHGGGQQWTVNPLHGRGNK